MKKYCVRLIKYETYYVDADNEDNAIDIACELSDEDPNAWLEPADEFEVEMIEEN